MDTENTPQDPSQTPPSQEGTQEQGSSSTPPTPQTPTPPAPPTNSREKELYEAVIREQNARIQALQDQVNRTPVNTPAQPEPTPDERRAAFYNDPLTHTRTIIKDELERTVAPLLDFVKSFKGEGSPYQQLKAKFQADPRYSNLLANPKIATGVEILMSKTETTPENMQAAIIQVAGLEMTGQLDAALIAAGVSVSNFAPPTPPAPTPATPPVNNMNTPYVPPSAPRTPAGGTPQNKPRELTELERRLARERGMSDPDYLAWLEAPANSVATSKIGRSA